MLSGPGARVNCGNRLTMFVAVLGGVHAHTVAGCPRIVASLISSGSLS
jgi:hypothetical protein